MCVSISTPLTAVIYGGQLADVAALLRRLGESYQRIVIANEYAPAAPHSTGARIEHVFLTEDCGVSMHEIAAAYRADDVFNLAG